MDELLKNPVFATHAIAAAGSVAVGTALTYPLDAVKTLIQVGSSSSKQLTSAQVTSATSVASTVSITRNAVAPMSSKLLQSCIPNKAAFEHSVNLLAVLNSKHQNLIDALKNYPWMMTGSGKPPAVSDVRQLLDIVKLEGWRALWSGLRAGLARDCVYGGIFFSTWQFSHQVMLNWKAVGMDPLPESDDEVGPLSPLAISLAAGFSGSIAAAASHGFDTAKSRSQCIVMPKFLSMERRLLKWKRPGNWFERVTGIHPSDRNILLRGIWLRMARSGIASFMIVGSYFLAVDYLVARVNRGGGR
ncbi:hypothetical protein Ancab_014803 [Ancistrocladus abbreviatus]